MNEIQKKIVAFDMDGTLATSRFEKLDDKNKQLFQRLVDKYLVVIISSGSCERLVKQVGDINGAYYVMGNYGLKQVQVIDNQIDEKSVVEYSYYDTLNIKKINEKISQLRDLTGYTKFEGMSHIISESGLIAISLVGTDAAPEIRNSFDPDGSKRTEFINAAKESFSDFNMFIGGKTSIDVLLKGIDKFWALDNFCKSKNLSIDHAVYFGDEILLDNGNDHSILENNVDCCNVDSPSLLQECVESLQLI